MIVLTQKKQFDVDETTSAIVSSHYVACKGNYFCRYSHMLLNYAAIV